MTIPVLPINAEVPLQDVRANVLRGHFDLLTEQDMALLIDVEDRTLTVWRSRGEGPPYVKLGRKVFYRAEDIREWIFASRAVPHDCTINHTTAEMMNNSPIYSSGASQRHDGLGDENR